MLKTRLLSLLLTLITCLPAFAADKQKVVYHLADEDKARQTTVKFNGLTGNVTFFDGYQQPSESVMEAD